VGEPRLGRVLEADVDQDLSTPILALQRGTFRSGSQGRSECLLTEFASAIGRQHDAENAHLDVLESKQDIATALQHFGLLYNSPCVSPILRLNIASRPSHLRRVSNH
jgi:hypothetical protein